MTYLPYGLTRIKQGSAWKPIKSLWYKQPDGTWIAVKTAWTKRSDGVWERIFPTPAGVNTATPTSFTVEVYQHWRPFFQTINFTNVGDRALTVANVIAYDGTNTTTTLDFAGTNGGMPYTIDTGGTGSIVANVYGKTVGTSSGNITFINNTGYFGSDGNVAYWPGNQTVVPITTTVLPAYSDITTVPGPANTGYTYYQGATSSGNLIITNAGTGANLTVSGITSGTYTQVSDFVGNIGANFTTFTGNSVSRAITLANLKAGTYQDQFVVNSNARNKNTYRVPVTLNVLAAHGSQDFTTVGTYTWTVLAGVLSINVTALGGGGGGGGNDASAGHSGYSGHLIAGPLNVVPGDVLTFYIGGGGSGGYSSNQSPVGSGPGGWGAGTYDGGRGGNAGSGGSSGGGGGGGGATVILKNGSTAVVAGGGGGGGGGGWHSAGRGRLGYSSSSSTAGGAGQDYPGDGAGGGGGGGGLNGGGGGGLVGGDNGAYSGSDGADIVPGGCTVIAGNYNDGPTAASGGNGYVLITW